MLNNFFYQIEDYLIYCKMKGLATKTIKAYEQSLYLFARYCSDERDIDDAKDVTERVVSSYLEYVKKRGKYTVATHKHTKQINNPDARKDLGKRVTTTTVNNYLRNIKAFFAYCLEYQITNEHPAINIKIMHNPRKSKQTITDLEWKTLITNFDLSNFVEYRDFTVTNLLFDSGMRVTECLLIKIEDIDMQQRAIFLPANNTKGKKDRNVYFSNEMRLILRRWLKYKDLYTECDYLFHTQRNNVMNVHNFGKNFRKYCKRIELEGVSPHVLRNNFAKRFLINGGNLYVLSQILGHSSVSVTERAYLDLNNEEIRKSYQNFSPLARM